MCLEIFKLRSKKRDNFQLDIEKINIKDRSTVAIIGANGSGKTTFMEAVTGLIKTEIKDISILGMDAKSFEKNVKNKGYIGVQLQKSQYNKELNVRDLVKLFKVMYGKSSDFIFSSLDIYELLNLRYEKLSRGQRQRVDLYLALSHEPKLIFLDEPNTGLDMYYQNILTEILKDMKSDSSTIVMASHTKSEIDICEKVILMEAGKVKFYDSFDEIIERTVGKYKLEASSVDEKSYFELDRYLKSSNDVIKTIRDKENLKHITYLKTNIINSFLTDLEQESYSKITVSECGLDDLVNPPCTCEV